MSTSRKAVLSVYWLSAGFLVFLALGMGTTALEEYRELPRPFLAAVAAGLLFAATGLIAAAVAPLKRPTDRKRRAAFAVSVVGLAAAVYVFVAAAPGPPEFNDSWGEGIAAMVGLWLGLSALAHIDRRVAWRVVGAGCILLFVASVALTVWDGQ